MFWIIQPINDHKKEAISNTDLIYQDIRTKWLDVDTGDMRKIL